MGNLSPELQKLKDISDDFRRYCLNNLKVKTKTGDIIPFEPNHIQNIIINAVVDDLENDRPIRYIILKARQEGVSTLVEALIYWWTATHKNVKSKIVAHDQDTAEQLYAMFRRYYDNSNPMFKPQTKYNTRSDLTFDNDDGTGLKSSIDVSSAKNTGTGRGQTINWLHGSEVSLWPNGSELTAGLMQAVPKLPKTAIFLESTANGMGDFFHKTWQAAKAGNSVFKPLFFSWAEHLEYQMPVPKHFRLTDEEQKIKAEHNLSMEQMVWRRETMKEFADDDRKFYQEYPLTDIEAFLSSGSSRFNIPALVKMEEKAYEPKQYDLIERKQTNKTLQFGRQSLEFEAIEVKGAPLSIWKKPEPAKSYVIGADVAEGINGDFSVATVMDIDACETVARWRGDAEPADFGEILEQLGRYYNNALIACEINNHGLTTVQRLRDMSYGNLYRRESGIDERFEQYTSKLGWRTDRKTKPLMINALAEAIMTGKIIDYDPTFIRECMEYVVDDRGRTNAQEGAHDDCFIRDTKILTNNGNIPIQNINVGDLVMTRDGYKPVVAIRKRYKPVISKLGLTGTKEHPVITPSKDIALQNIGRHDTIYTWNEKQSHIKEKNITGTLIQKGNNLGIITGDTTNGKRRLWRIIANFGLIISEIFQMDSMSIMSMENPSTMKSQILNYKQNGNIYTTIYLHQREKRSQDKTLKTSLLNHMISFVWFAVKPLRVLGKLVQNIVVHSVLTLIGERRVYNLQVADKPEYFANGILVHNCVIATAIALQVFEWNPILLESRSVPSKLPKKYQEIRQKQAQLAKKR